MIFRHFHLQTGCWGSEFVDPKKTATRVQARGSLRWKAYADITSAVNAVQAPDQANDWAQNSHQLAEFSNEIESTGNPFIGSSSLSSYRWQIAENLILCHLPHRS